MILGSVANESETNIFALSRRVMSGEVLTSCVSVEKGSKAIDLSSMAACCPKIEFPGNTGWAARVAKFNVAKRKMKCTSILNLSIKDLLNIFDVFL